MHSSELHFLVNHFPITGVLIGLFVLVAGLLFKKEQVRITALGIFIFSGFAAIIAHLTGEGAEILAKKAGNYSETMLHLHEEHSYFFVVIVLLLGLVAAVTYVLHLRKMRKITTMYLIVLVFSISALVIGYSVSKSGYQIYHPEIRNSNKVIDVQSMR